MNNESCIYNLLKGNTDAVIVPMSIEKKDFASHVCVGILFKTPTTMSDNDSKKQFLLQFIGALSSNKNLPILFVCTDFHSFKFLWLSDQEKKIIHCFETRDVCNSIKLIKEFIENHHSIAINPPMNQQVFYLFIFIYYTQNLIDINLFLQVVELHSRETLSSEPNCATELCSTQSSDQLSDQLSDQFSDEISENGIT